MHKAISGYILTFFYGSAITLAVITVTSVAVFAAEPDTPDTSATPDIMELSIDEGVKMVLTNNLDVIIERVSPRIKEALIESEEGAFDNSVFSSFRYTDSTSPLNARSIVAAGGRSSVETETFYIDMGVSSRSYSGTEYSIEFNDNATASTFNDFDYEYDSFVGVKMTKPLLKGAGEEVNLYSVTVARKNREISLLAFKEKATDAVASFELAYWDLVQASEELDLKRESLRLAEALYGESVKKLDAEVISRLELTQAKAGVASRNEAVVTAENSVMVKENSLKRLISKDVFSLRGVRVVPVDEPEIDGVPSLEEGIAVAFTTRPDYLEAKVVLEKGEIDIRYLENGLHPEVDLEASYGYNGLGGSFSDSISSMDSNPEWSVGIVFSYPLGNSSAKADLRAARLEAKLTLLKLKRVEQEIITALADAIDGMGASRRRLEAARVSTALQEDSLEAEEAKLEAGLSTAINVLGLLEDLEEARSRELAARIDFEREMTIYLREEGSLLAERGYVFGKGLSDGLPEGVR